MSASSSCTGGESVVLPLPELWDVFASKICKNDEFGLFLHVIYAKMDQKVAAVVTLQGKAAQPRQPADQRRGAAGKGGRGAAAGGGAGLAGQGQVLQK